MSEIPTAPPVRIGVVACSKTKAPTKRRAEELYTGRTFKAAVALLRARGCTRIIVLSALYGAIDGDREIEPYERSFDGMDAESRRVWAITARAGLSNLVHAFAGKIANADVLAIVPKAYEGALAFVPNTRLFRGLPQGKLYSEIARELLALQKLAPTTPETTP